MDLTDSPEGSLVVGAIVEFDWEPADQDGYHSRTIRATADRNYRPLPTGDEPTGFHSSLDIGG